MRPDKNHQEATDLAEPVHDVRAWEPCASCLCCTVWCRHTRPLSRLARTRPSSSSPQCCGFLRWRSSSSHRVWAGKVELVNFRFVVDNLAALARWADRRPSKNICVKQPEFNRHSPSHVHPSDCGSQEQGLPGWWESKWGRPRPDVEVMRFRSNVKPLSALEPHQPCNAKPVVVVANHWAEPSPNGQLPLPVCILSSHGTPETHADAHAQGCFLPHPFDGFHGIRAHCAPRLGRAWRVTRIPLVIRCQA